MKPRVTIALSVLTWTVVVGLLVWVLLVLLVGTAFAGPREGLILHPPKVTLPTGWQDYSYHAVPCPAYASEVACIFMVEQWNESTATGERFDYRFDADIFIPASWGNGKRAREVALHEYGHAFDILHLDDAERLQFMQLNHLAGGAAAWEDPLDNSEFPASPDELFADAYAWCGLTTAERRQLGASWAGDVMNGRVVRYTRRMMPTIYGWTPTKRQARATCRLIRGAP